MFYKSLFWTVFWTILSFAIALVVAPELTTWLGGDPTPEQIKALVLPATLSVCRPERLEMVRYALFLILLGIYWGITWIIDRKASFPSDDQKSDSVFGFILLVLVVGGVVWMSLYQERKILPYFRSFHIVQGILLTFACYMSARLGLFLAGLMLLDRLTYTIITAGTLPFEMPEIQFHFPYFTGDFLAVGNGLTPLVDYVPMYSRVLSWAGGPLIRFLGFSIGGFSAWMFFLNFTLILLLLRWIYRVYDNLPAYKWVASISMLAVLGVMMIPMGEQGPSRYFVLNYFSLYPLRMFFPILTGWVLIKRESLKNRGYILGIISTIGFLNAPDFGAPALFACLISIAWSVDRQNALRCFSHFLAGMVYVLIGILGVTYLRAHALPRLDLFLEYYKTFAWLGIFMLPHPWLGLHGVILATFITCVAAGIRMASSQDVILKRSLLYMGLFGLGSFTYYIGRSHAQVLMSLFPLWMMANVLLLRAVFILKFKGAQRVLIAYFFGWVVLATGSVFPIRGLARLNWVIHSKSGLEAQIQKRAAEVRNQPSGPWGKTVVTDSYAHWIAIEAGVKNPFPYAGGIGAVYLKSQLDFAEAMARK